MLLTTALTTHTNNVPHATRHREIYMADWKRLAALVDYADTVLVDAGFPLSHCAYKAAWAISAALNAKSRPSRPRIQRLHQELVRMVELGASAETTAVASAAAAQADENAKAANGGRLGGSGGPHGMGVGGVGGGKAGSSGRAKRYRYDRKTSELLKAWASHPEVQAMRGDDWRSRVRHNYQKLMAHLSEENCRRSDLVHLKEDKVVEFYGNMRKGYRNTKIRKWVPMTHRDPPASAPINTDPAAAAAARAVAAVARPAVAQAAQAATPSTAAAASAAAAAASHAAQAATSKQVAASAAQVMRGVVAPSAAAAAAAAMAAAAPATAVNNSHGVVAARKR